MTIGLIDLDGRVPNLALMQLSSFFKKAGERVVLNDFKRSEVEQVFVSTLFTWNRGRAEGLLSLYPGAVIGGSGWDLEGRLPFGAEAFPPDYSLYRTEDVLPRLKGIMTREKRLEKASELVSAGIGYTTRGCIRRCPWCPVWRKEGELKQVAPLSSLVNPASRLLVLLDNNLLADPLCLDKLAEARERRLVLDLTQGIDLRCLDEEKALALSRVRHWKSLHYAFDRPSDEGRIVEGIRLLSRYVAVKRHRCYVLTGYDTSFEEDVHRVRTLIGMKVAPYVMLYDDRGDVRQRHFERYINGFFYKSCAFDDYRPWVRDRGQYELGLGAQTPDSAD